MPSEDFTIRETDGVSLVKLTVDNLLNIAEVSRVGNDLNKLVDQGRHRLVIDLGSIIYAGSATLGMLLSIREKVGEKKGKLVLTGIGQIEKLFSLSRTKALFEIAATPAEAIALCKNQ